MLQADGSWLGEPFWLEGQTRARQDKADNYGPSLLRMSL